MQKSWVGLSGGAWSADANWQPGIAATTADDATITGPSGSSYQIVAGPGNSASLTLVGNTTLSGTFNTGALSVGTAALSGGLSLAAGAILNTTTATLLTGPLQATGTGTKLAVSGTLTVGGTRTAFGYVLDALSAGGGATVQAGNIAMVAMSNAGDSLSVDATSSIEVGTVGAAALGKLTIDAGRSLTGTGNVTASNGIVNNGTIIAQGGNLFLDPITGSGSLQIAAGGSLSVRSNTEAISFTGSGGALRLTAVTNYSFNGLSTNSLNEQGIVNGFVQGDVISILNFTSGSTPLTSVSYQAGTGGLGTLTLKSNTTILDTLTLAGDYTGQTFQLTPTTNSSTSNIVVSSSAIQASPDQLFDPIYYLANNSDVAAAGVDPYQHYMVSGWKEGRDPSALFNTKYYLDQNPDVKAAGINPLSHFETNGWKEGRDPSAAFSDSRYLAAYPDVKAAGIDPLVHYVVSGKAEGRTSFAVLGPQDALVNAAYVYAHNPAVAAAGLDATAWYHSTGWKTGTNPNAFFDTNYYLKQNQDVKAAGVDPLAHFETSGWQENRQPSLVFDDAKYLAANADVKAAGIDPLLHYITSGQSEGRLSFITGGTAAADPLVNAAYYDQQLGASLIPTGTAAAQQAAWSYDTTGWQKGLNPDAFFDTNYYLSHNSDVAAAHIDPLMHYESNGWKEGRDPSATFSTNKYLAAYGDVKNAGLDPLLHYVAYGQGEGRTAFSA